jgi:hypothetical protein
MARMATVSLKVGGVLQLFVIQSGGTLFTSWKSSDDINAPWVPLRQFIPNPGSVTDITAGQLSDGRAQLFASTSAGGLITIWKATTAEEADWVSGVGEAWVPLNLS